MKELVNNNFKTFEEIHNEKSLNLTIKSLWISGVVVLIAIIIPFLVSVFVPTTTQKTT
ncbi:MAG: hypothetical protein LUH15_14120 [Tannerellaceae bacterium]|nr:hypothetical protein [Tannerellaceae bacterium]